MVRTRSKDIVLWPAYFDLRKSRDQGRRVSKKMAVENPEAAEIHKIAKKLGFKSQLKNDKSYPASWWEGGGCVLVEKGQKKTEIINLIATELAKSKTG